MLIKGESACSTGLVAHIRWDSNCGREEVGTQGLSANRRSAAVSKPSAMMCFGFNHSASWCWTISIQSVVMQTCYNVASPFLPAREQSGYKPSDTIRGGRQLTSTGYMNFRIGLEQYSPLLRNIAKQMDSERGKSLIISHIFSRQ